MRMRWFLLYLSVVFLGYTVRVLSGVTCDAVCLRLSCPVFASTRWMIPKTQSSLDRITSFQIHRGNQSYRPTERSNQAQAETELGMVANEHMTRGEMLPSEVVLSLVIKRLEQRDCVQNGWILDGKKAGKKC